MLSVISLPIFETVLHNSKMSSLNRWYSCANVLVAVHRSLNVIYCWLYLCILSLSESFCMCFNLVLYSMFMSVWLSLILWVLTWNKRVDWLIDWLTDWLITKDDSANYGTCCAECSKLTFSNCIRCSDVSPATAESQCYECDERYTLKEDKSSCTSMHSWLLLTLNIFHQNVIYA